MRCSEVRFHIRQGLKDRPLRIQNLVKALVNLKFRGKEVFTEMVLCIQRLVGRLLCPAKIWSVLLYSFGLTF